jgi:hypothetical protein
MAFTAGSHALGPGQGTLQIRTYREGVAAKVGHDLVIEVTEWSATVEVGANGVPTSVVLDAGPRSLVVREGLHGIKPLSEGDRADIRRTIDKSVLAGRPIGFRSNHVAAAANGSLRVSGDLTLGGATRPLTFTLVATPDGSLRGEAEVIQSAWGIKPYRGLMGALRVRDAVEIAVDVRLPGS